MERAWFATSTVFTNHLDVDQIYACLCMYLTGPEKDTLRSRSVGPHQKIQDLMAWMPRKGGSWFVDFVGVLKKTKQATGHSTIIEALKGNLRECAKQKEIFQETIENTITGTYCKSSI